MIYNYLVINMFIFLSLRAFQMLLWNEVGKFNANANPFNRVHR